MKKAVFETYSPGVKLLLLVLLAIAGLMAFMFMGGAVIKMLWGFNIIGDPSVLQNLNDPFVVDANRLLILFQHLGLFIVPSIVFLQLSSVHPAKFISLQEKIYPKIFILTLILLMGLMPFINLLITWNEALKLPAFLAGVEESMRRMEDAAAALTDAMVKMDNPAEFFYMTLLMAVLPAIGEELMFRGIIQRLFAVRMKNYHWGIWISAFLFSAMHLQFYGFLPRMLLGAVFGYMLVYTGNILYPVLAHFFNNFISLLVAYGVQHGRIAREIDTIGENYEWAYIIPGLILSAGLLIFLWKRRNPRFIREYLNPVSLQTGNGFSDAG